MTGNWDQKTALQMVDRTVDRINSAISRNPYDKEAWEQFDEGTAKAFRDQDMVQLKIVCEAYTEAQIYETESKRITGGDQGPRTSREVATGRAVEKTGRVQKQTPDTLADLFAVR